MRNPEPTTREQVNYLCQEIQSIKHTLGQILELLISKKENNDRKRN